MHGYAGRQRRDRRRGAAQARQVQAPPASSRRVLIGSAGPLDARRLLHLQRLAGNGSVGELVRENVAAGRAGVLDIIRSRRGQPIDDSTRKLMEAGFGHDFGEVRVHTDAAATASAKSVSAHAYTVGDDIVFQSGLYNPHSDAGRRMLAHELAHVIQQRSGPVTGRHLPGGIAVSDPGDAFERQADHAAERALGEVADTNRH